MHIKPTYKSKKQTINNKKLIKDFTFIYTYLYILENQNNLYCACIYMLLLYKKEGLIWKAPIFTQRKVKNIT